MCVFTARGTITQKMTAALPLAGFVINAWPVAFVPCLAPGNLLASVKARGRRANDVLETISPRWLWHNEPRGSTVGAGSMMERVKKAVLGIRSPIYTSTVRRCCPFLLGKNIPNPKANIFYNVSSCSFLLSSLFSVEDTEVLQSQIHAKNG